MVDISGRNEDYEAEVDIREYLPDNVFLADPSQARISVAVHIQKEITRRLAVRGEGVSVMNVPEGFTASISELEESLILEIVGLPEEIAGLSANDMEGKVDIAEWMREEGMDTPEEGFYQVEVDFGLPENVRIADPVVVTMHLSKIEEE
jgi:YbbR domain-containing protein